MQITIEFDGSITGDLVSLDLTCAVGSPCDAFEATLLYSPQTADAARKCSRVRIYAGGELRFTGVPDEVTATGDGNGRLLEVSGRGLAALLMDYKLTGTEFAVAQLRDIKRRLIDPCGVALDADPAALAPVQRFSITGGTSAWSALCDWAGGAGKLAPSFRPDGTLVLRKNGRGGTLRLDGSSPVFSNLRRTLRAGAVSEVTVFERTTGRSVTRRSDALRAMGVRGRDTIAAARGALEARIPSADWLLEQSERKFDRFSVEVSGGFVCQPDDVVECSHAPLPSRGVVDSVRTRVDRHGARSIVEGYVDL